MEWTDEIFRLKADRVILILMMAPNVETHPHIHPAKSPKYEELVLLWNKHSQHRDRSGTWVLGDRNRIGFVTIAGSTLVSLTARQMMFKPIFFRNYQPS